MARLCKSLASVGLSFAMPMAFASAPAAHAAVTISTAATKNMNCSGGVCTPTAKDAVLNVSQLEGLLQSASVTVNTAGSKASDIDVAAALTWAASNGLTLDAYHSIKVEKAVSDGGGGSLSLATNDGGGTGGMLWFAPRGRISFMGTSNALTINGQAYTLASNVASLAADIAAHPAGDYALSSNYNAKPDGTYTASPIPTIFTGALNGLGNEISNLRISTTTKGENVGLFAEQATSGVINSIRLTNAHVKSKKNSIVGTMIGVNYGTIFNSTGSGEIISAAETKGAPAIGGLAGSNPGIIEVSVASVTVTVNSLQHAAFTNAGGLAGANDGTIENSFATAAVTVTGPVPGAAGGFVGFNDGIVQNCYATGSASLGGLALVGGLVGENGKTISSAYSTGAASGGSGSYIGGSIGYDASGGNGGSVSDDYWDTTTSGITNLSQGAGNIANDPGITGETTAQLQAGLPAGFDPAIWAENPNINGGLPYLIANPPQ